MPLQYQIQGPKPPISGPSTPATQTDVLTVSQPERLRYLQLQASRYIVPSKAVLENLTPPPQSYIFAVGQPVSISTYSIPKVMPVYDITAAPPPPNQQSFIFSVSQPIRRRQYQLPRPRPPIDVGSSATYTLPVSSGTFLITGSVTTFKWNHALAAQSGTYTINGSNATLFTGIGPTPRSVHLFVSRDTTQSLLARKEDPIAIDVSKTVFNLEGSES